MRVHLAHLEDPFVGLYDDGESCIYVRLGLPMAEVKATLAHELGHALYRHDCSTPEHERQADRRAAALLVDVTKYEAAERINPFPEAIAEELDLTPKVVRDFQSYWLERTGPAHAADEG